MQRRANSRSSRTAVERVSQVWSTCAVHTRGELRAYGIRGELRRLDDYAAGERGTGFARMLHDFIAYCRDNRMPPERIEHRLHLMTSEAVRVVSDTPAA